MRMPFDSRATFPAVGSVPDGAVRLVIEEVATEAPASADGCSFQDNSTSMLPLSSSSSGTAAGAAYRLIG